MHFPIVLSAVLGLAAAAPKPVPNGIDARAVDVEALAGIALYNPSVATRRHASGNFPSKPFPQLFPRLRNTRATVCTPEPYGTGPIPGDGSVAAYKASGSILAGNATAATDPCNYRLISGFQNLQAAAESSAYLGYTVVNGTNYNNTACAVDCNKTNNCVSFNIYYERDPKYTASADCPNPAPITNIKCAFYSVDLTASEATNVGSYRGPPDSGNQTFQVVIAGSNAYNFDSSDTSGCPT